MKGDVRRPHFLQIVFRFELRHFLVGNVFFTFCEVVVLHFFLVRFVLGEIHFTVEHAIHFVDESIAVFFLDGTFNERDVVRLALVVVYVEEAVLFHCFDLVHVWNGESCLLQHLDKGCR